MSTLPPSPTAAPLPRGRTAANLLAIGSSAGAAAALVLTHGFHGGDQSVALRVLSAAAAGGFIAELALRWWGRRWRPAFLREEVTEVLPAALLPPALVAVVIWAPGRVTTVVEVYLGAALLAQVVRVYRAAHEANLAPAHLLVLSWVGAIVIGAGLLSLPRATASGRSAPPTTALFTATSAVCVTGLIVEDTGSYWSQGGQLVILVLIQLGGVGLMTFAAFFALVLRRGLALRERVVLRDILSQDLSQRAARLMGAILGVTVALEVLGTLLLYGMWDPATLEHGGRLYYSVFHAISAFCNAGFCLFRTSFVDYADRWQMTLVVPGLIIIGGLGFTVLVNLSQVLWPRVRRRLTGVRTTTQRLSLQSALVLTTTAVLLLAGTALVLVLERGATLRGMSAGQALRRAFFQSVTARTAGFNTVRIAAASLPAACVLMAWMFIGASPGSTGGGIKTATVAVLLSNLWATLRRRARIEALHRTIPAETVRRALAVASVAVLTIACLILALAITERDLLAGADGAKRFGFEDLCFEAFSAFGTVGLSRGITGHLSAAGRLVICVGMFVGRIGPLTLAVAMYGQARRGRYEYPQEAVMIG